MTIYNMPLERWGEGVLFCFASSNLQNPQSQLNHLHGTRIRIVCIMRTCVRSIMYCVNTRGSKCLQLVFILLSDSNMLRILFKKANIQNIIFKWLQWPETHKQIICMMKEQSYKKSTVCACLLHFYSTSYRFLVHSKDIIRIWPWTQK